MQLRGRSFIGTAITLRGEDREAEIVDAEYNAYAYLLQTPSLAREDPFS